MSRTRVIFTIAAIAIGLSGCAATGTKSASTSVPASTSTGTVDSYTPPTDSDTTTADATEPASQPPNTYNDMPLGRSITVTGTDNNEKPYKVTVTAHAKPKTSKRAVVDYGEAPKHTFVGIEVEYSCLSGTCSYNPYDFTFRGSDGTEYDQAIGWDPTLNSGDLHPGRKAKGWITYDVPKGSYFLEYQTSIVDNDSASWKVRVG
jgi:hypothetical protein